MQSWWQPGRPPQGVQSITLRWRSCGGCSCCRCGFGLHTGPLLACLTDGYAPKKCALSAVCDAGMLWHVASCSQAGPHNSRCAAQLCAGSPDPHASALLQSATAQVTQHHQNKTYWVVPKYSPLKCCVGGGARRRPRGVAAPPGLQGAAAVRGRRQVRRTAAGVDGVGSISVGSVRSAGAQEARQQAAAVDLQCHGSVLQRRDSHAWRHRSGS